MSSRRASTGFSLLELLAVMAVAGMMLSLLVPSLAGFHSTYSRRQAVDTLMETLEQARMMALQSGGKVHVIFAKSTDTGQSEDGLIVTGEPPLGSPNANQVLYTRWIKLPAGVCFRSATGTLGTSDLPDSTVLQALPPRGSAATFVCVIFNSAGQVEYPADRPLKLALFEGVRQGGQEQAAGASAKATQNLAAGGLYDVVSITRFTGRSRVDTASLE